MKRARGWEWVLLASTLVPAWSWGVETDIRGNLRGAPGLVGLTLPPTYRNAVDQLIGTGDGELSPYVAVSRVFWDRVEPYWNAGFNFNVTDSDESSGHYSFGVTVQALERLGFAGAVLGRSEVTNRSEVETVGGPHQTPVGTAITPYAGVNTDRNDFFDATLGAHLRVYKTAVLTFGFYKAINSDGLRTSEWSPVGGLQGTF